MIDKWTDGRQTLGHDISSLVTASGAKQLKKLKCKHSKLKQFFKLKGKYFQTYRKIKDTTTYTKFHPMSIIQGILVDVY